MNPMLASDAKDFDAIVYPKLLSPKLDGIRCLVQGGVALTRSLKPIPNQFISSVLSKTKLNGLDGELIVGPPSAKDVWQTTTSGVMTVSGQPDFQFFVFDDAACGGGFAKRLQSAKNRIALFGRRGPVAERLALVHHNSVFNHVELSQHEEGYLSDGYEGVMLRDPEGPYKEGRATEREGWLLKVKRFTDGEAVVVAVQEQLTNGNERTLNELGKMKRSGHAAGKTKAGRLGALLVKDVASGVEFGIGTGFADKVRWSLWAMRKELVGKVVKYKFQPVGVKEKPRFPVFMGFRDARDM